MAATFIIRPHIMQSRGSHLAKSQSLLDMHPSARTLLEHKKSLSILLSVPHSQQQALSFFLLHSIFFRAQGK